MSTVSPREGVPTISGIMNVTRSNDVAVHFSKENTNPPAVLWGTHAIGRE